MNELPVSVEEKSHNRFRTFFTRKLVIAASYAVSLAAAANMINPNFNSENTSEIYLTLLAFAGGLTLTGMGIALRTTPLDQAAPLTAAEMPQAQQPLDFGFEA
jgi:hypothetical protein